MVGLAVLLGDSPALAKMPPREAFEARHLCSLTAMLNEIHRRGPVNTTRDRFIVVDVADRFQQYVQCIFTERESAMYCEASSGAYATSPVSSYEFRPTVELTATLRRLGYRQAMPKENFSQVIEIGMPPDVGIAARLMLATLYEAYGARASSILKIAAPRAGDAAMDCGVPAR